MAGPKSAKLSGTNQSTGLMVRRNTYEEKKKQDFANLCMSDTPYRDILKYVNNEIRMSTEMSDFNYKILCFKDDGVFQLNKAITKVYGVSAGKPDEKPSGGEYNLQMIDVTLANGERHKVPYGKISLPDAGEGAMIDIRYNDASNELHVVGSCQFQFSSMIDEIIEITKFFLNSESIYSSQAIEIGEATGNGQKFQPKVLNLSNIDKEFMVLSKVAERNLIPVYARIRKPAECIAKGISLKTGVLLEGKYGTGKTLLAFKLAKEAIANNWCFIYLKDPTMLAQTLRLSKTLDKNGNGVIVFLEDIDQVTRGNRDANMQDILNTLDGGDTKQMNVIAVFTTNHIELIEPTFLRGKRIGSVVTLDPLDRITSMQFLEHAFTAEYNLLRDDKLEKVCEFVEQNEIVPAFMAEIVEKIKANLVFSDTLDVTAEDVEAATKSYLRQVGLASKKDMSKTAKDNLWDALREVARTEPDLVTKVDEIHEATA